MMTDVEMNGKHYQEMHVDGGASRQVFVYPPKLQLAQLSKEAGIQRERKLFVICNARLDPDWADTKRAFVTIAQRAVSTLIQTQGESVISIIYGYLNRVQSREGGIADFGRARPEAVIDME
jgi:hypothetical protein